MKTVLTIAGSDSSGGAGIQADLKTYAAFGVYGMSAITAITAQNTLGVTKIQDIDTEVVAAQLDAVFTDIFPDAVKIGMVSSSAIIDVIAEKLKFYGAQKVVLDPVMVSTTGFRLLDEAAQTSLLTRLLPQTDIITPNMAEGEILAGMKISDRAEMSAAAQIIAADFDGAVLLKGGHLPDEAADLLYRGGTETWFVNARIETENTHGTGCTLSSAIAAGLALGEDLATSVGNAVAYVHGALADGLELGHGNGPLNHLYRLRNKGVCEDVS